MVHEIILVSRRHYMAKANGKVPTTLRLPADLRQQVERRARREQRSLQQQCLYLIQRGLREKPAEA